MSDTFECDWCNDEVVEGDHKSIKVIETCGFTEVQKICEECYDSKSWPGDVLDWQERIDEEKMKNRGGLFK